MKTKTKIIAATPGCGKTYAAEHLDNAIDLEYSHYDYLIDKNGKKLRDEKGNKIKNFAFPKNYIDKIKSCMGNYQYVFICTHDMVLRELIKENIPFTVVIPKKEMRNVWLNRYITRNDDNYFISTQMAFWDTWLDELKANMENFEELMEIDDEYLIDII